MIEHATWLNINVLIVISFGTEVGRGIYTIYKRWSKCTMEKVRGKVFTAFSGI